MPIGSEGRMSKSEKKFEEFGEIGKVDDNNINDNFDGVDEDNDDIMFSSLLSHFSYNPAVFFGSC